MTHRTKLLTADGRFTPACTCGWWGADSSDRVKAKQIADGHELEELKKASGGTAPKPPK